MKNKRQLRIVEILRVEKSATPAHLSKELGVSEASIRRDLAELSEQGLIKRVHGGAMLEMTHAPGYQVRSEMFNEKKQIITEKVLPLIKEKMTICIDGGSTNVYLAQHLPPVELTVVTNSVPVIEWCRTQSSIHLVVLGGSYHPEYSNLYGTEAINAISNMIFDIAFIGVWNIHADLGLSASLEPEARTKKAILQSSQKTVALALSHKLDTASSYRICSLEEIDYMVTDLDPKSPVLANFHKSKITIL